MNATCVLENKNPSSCCDGPTVPLISEGQCPTSGCGKIAIFQSDCSPIHDLVAILDAKMSAKIRYGNLAHVSGGCRQKHYIQNCGQKAAERDMVTFNSLSSLSPYPSVLLTL